MGVPKLHEHTPYQLGGGTDGGTAGRRNALLRSPYELNLIGTPVAVGGLCLCEIVSVRLGPLRG